MRSLTCPIFSHFFTCFTGHRWNARTTEVQLSILKLLISCRYLYFWPADRALLDTPSCGQSKRGDPIKKNKTNSSLGKGYPFLTKSNHSGGLVHFHNTSMESYDDARKKKNRRGNLGGKSWMSHDAAWRTHQIAAPRTRRSVLVSMPRPLSLSLSLFSLGQRPRGRGRGTHHLAQ